MDFVSYIRDQSEKLTVRDYVDHLWNELEGKQIESEISPTYAAEYHNHLPLALDQFWEFALEKLNDSEIGVVDEDFKVYLLVLIYQTFQTQETTSGNSIFYASEVYFSLLSSQSDGFFNSKLYKMSLTSLQTAVENLSSEKLINRQIFRLRIFLSKATKLNNIDLELTVATLMQVIFLKTRKIYSNFDVGLDMVAVPHEALLGLKLLFEKETVVSHKFLITTYLFNGLRKHSNLHLTPSVLNSIQTSLRKLLKSLRPKFQEDKYRTFLNAFIHVWKHPEFLYFGEAVYIMNGLKEKHYRSLIDILFKMMSTKNPHRNLFKLATTIICLPPKYVSEEKAKVTNEILVKAILLNILSPKNEVSTSALETFAELLISPDFQKDYIKEPVKIILKGQEEQMLNTSTILNALESLMQKKWSNRSKNKSLFVIAVSIMLISDEDYPEHYSKILELLGEEASPYDLKPYLPLLSETYLRLVGKEYSFSASQILKMIFKLALHPMASSADFVKYLYMAMVYPSIYKNQADYSDLFINSIISDDFNYGEFFQKCSTVGLIKNEHVSKLLGSLSSIKESQLKLLCAIVHLTGYKENIVIAEHINAHFMTICNTREINYLFYIYHNLVKTNSSQQNLRGNELMVYFLRYHLLNQNFRCDCVANAFALLKTLSEVIGGSQDFTVFQEEYDRRLSSTLENRGSFQPLFYYSQLVIFGKLVPSEQNLKSVSDFLSLCSDEVYRRSPEFNLKLYLGCLMLYTNVSVIRTNLVDASLEFLHQGLRCSYTSVKLASINMYFDLSNLITHNFEDLIKYIFNELIFGNDVFKKTCLMKLDSLIRDDYLKLELEQFVVFVSILGHRNVVLSDYARHLMSRSFLISNASVIAKYFVPLIVHLNGYRKHPLYEISDRNHELLQISTKNVADKRRIYSLLFSGLSVKAKFNILTVLCTNVLEKFMKGVMKFDSGFWKVIKDAICIFRQVSSSASGEESGANFYKKVAGQISKHILEKHDTVEKRLYPEYQKEVVYATETLLKLLFFNESDEVQKHIRILLFDTIMHWTSYLLADLNYAVHMDRMKGIQSSYVKFENFFKTHGERLRHTEESFETSGSSVSADSSFDSSCLFPIQDDYIPQFDSR